MAKKQIDKEDKLSIKDKIIKCLEELPEKERYAYNISQITNKDVSVIHRNLIRLIGSGMVSKKEAESNRKIYTLTGKKDKDDEVKEQ